VEPMDETKKIRRERKKRGQKKDDLRRGISVKRRDGGLWVGEKGEERFCYATRARGGRGLCFNYVENCVVCVADGITSDTRSREKSERASEGRQLEAMTD
jgi:hypothetical protein